MDEPKKNDLPLSKTTGILVDHISDPAIQIALTALIAIHPVWAILLSFAKPIIDTWGAFKQERVNELVVDLAKHKSEFIKSSIESNDFKTLFLNVLERHMKESSEEKRRLLRNYLLNTGRGLNPEFTEFTKMNSVLDTITLTEIDVLRLWDGLVQKFNQIEKNTGVTTYELVLIVSMQVSPGERDQKVPLKNVWPNRLWKTSNYGRGHDFDELNQILNLLKSKDLLAPVTETHKRWSPWPKEGEPTTEVVQGLKISDFGLSFLAFIKE